MKSTIYRMRDSSKNLFLSLARLRTSYAINRTWLMSLACNHLEVELALKFHDKERFSNGTFQASGA